MNFYTKLNTKEKVVYAVPVAFTALSISLMSLGVIINSQDGEFYRAITCHNHRSHLDRDYRPRLDVGVGILYLHLGDKG